MKSIPLKSLADPGGLPDIEYAQVLREVLKRPLDQQRGADISEMRSSLRVLDALEKSNGVLELEDADYEHLKTKVLAMPWNIIDRRIVEFVDDVSRA